MKRQEIQPRIAEAAGAAAIGCVGAFAWLLWEGRNLDSAEQLPAALLGAFLVERLWRFLELMAWNAASVIRHRDDDEGSR